MTIIYESPDKGKTVYARNPGETKRTLIQGSGDVGSLSDFRNIKLWNDIVEECGKDPALKKMLDKVFMYYKLKCPGEYVNGK